MHNHSLQSRKISDSKREVIGEIYKNCQRNWLPSEMPEKEPTIHCSMRRVNMDGLLIQKDAEKHDKIGGITYFCLKTLQAR